MDPEAVRIVALGGLGEVGRNMTVFEYHGKLLIVDCGVLFPEEDQPGVDLILPDFSYLDDRLDDIVGLVLTHGHEDHIGAVPYLLRRKGDIPILGSKLTIALIEAKLKEHRIKPITRVVKEDDLDQLGPFDLEFVAVNHSIPDALAVFIRTGAGNILHTGDFKMDQLPLDGRITDLRAFARLGEEGVDLFMTDSTNAEVPGFTALEKDIGPVLENLFGSAERRIIVASFSSHIHRVQQVLNAADAHGRKVALVGRSMVRNMKIAADLGYLEVPKGALIDIKEVEKLPDDQVVLMCTGSQGEPMAALSRMANRSHRVEVGDGDTVILASSLIPGNENSVFKVINGLMKLGARVISKADAKIHVSGHASGGELLYCYNIVKPRGVLPVHGEWRHMLANARHAEATGVDPDNIVLADDGWVVDLKDGRAEVVGAVDCNYVFVDGSSVGEITEADLKDRLVLSGEGFVTIFMAVNSQSKQLIAGPEIHARGVAESDDVFDSIVPKVTKAVEDALKDGNTDQYQLQQVVRRTVGRWVSSKLRRKPMIVPMVVIV
ncbi:ribonuclease J [Brevibacterium sp. GP-SGM9]|uniref:ribonuclease J n=1 Tax=unclassified Brevibacterium TaxID=2614124 RepID=UPI001E2A3828|nr:MULTISPECIES: ribonuclease J [unclassified Brevibacterium]MCD1285958.1 RNase J family beta-CASP ribonuclease [Brevibacterium sp. CCUG 69071]MDK8435024.1 ribonuclease J [Brevibacterium sp. H-BE7]